MVSRPRTWILLRGLGREKGHWGAFTESFKAKFPGDEVLALDLPGAGEFRADTSPADIGGIFEVVRARAIERARHQHAFHVLAVSLGGMVALEWMARRPEDLAGCVLINTSVKALSPAYHRLRWQVWARFAAILSMSSPREREAALVQMLMTSESARARALPLWAKLATEAPMRPQNFFRQLLAAAKFKLVPRPGPVPVLLLCALGDRLVDPSCSMDLHKATGWPLEKHPWAGHDLTWDDPDWVLGRIAAWSESAGRKAGEPG